MFSQKSPSQGVSIRAISPEKYTVINQATNEVIEEVEENKAFFEVFLCLQRVYTTMTFLHFFHRKLFLNYVVFQSLFLCKSYVPL